MNCEQCKQILVEYLEGLLEADRHNAAERHLKDCPSCQAELQQLMRLHERLITNGEALARRDMEDRVLNKIIREQKVRLQTGASAGKWPTIRRIIMKSPFAKIAAGVALVCALIATPWLLNQGTVAAFGQVIENVTKAGSVSFMHRQKIGSQPAMVFKMYIQGPKLRGDLVEMEGQAEGLDRLRGEMQQRNLSAVLSYIADFEQKDGLQLDHFRRTFTRIKVDDRAASEFTRVNLIQQFRNLKQADAEWIGEESHAGRKIDVYVVKHVELMGIKGELSGQQGDRMRVWVDRQTSLPVRILLEASFHVEGKSNDWLEFYDFAWNEPVDENLFKLEVPEGYVLAEPIVID